MNSRDTYRQPPSPPRDPRIRIPQWFRRLCSVLFFLFALTPLLRLTAFDVVHTRLSVLGIRFATDRIFIPVFLAFIFFFLLFFASARLGRFFCAWFCPMHLSLERTNHWSPRLKLAAGVVLSILFTGSALSLFLSPAEQWAHLQATHFPQPLLVVGAVLLFVLATIFLVYRDGFCRSACPYAILQHLTRTPETARMQFNQESGRCIDCGACDRVCPFGLNVRQESESPHCSNCGLCHEACRRVLGAEKRVLDLVRQEED